MKKSNQIPKDEYYFKLFQYPVVLHVWFYHGNTHENKDMADKAGMCQRFEDGRILMTLDVDTEDYDELFSTVVHEITHVKQMLEDAIDTTLDRESEAYFNGELYQKIINAIQTYNTKYAEWELKTKKETK